MKSDMAALSGLPLFSLLSEAERNTLGELFTSIDIRRGEGLFRRGDPGNSLYIVKRGKIQIVLDDVDGRRIILSENGPGALFGEISLLDGGPRTADAMASADSELLMLDRDDLLEFVTKHPPAALSLLKVMGQRLRATNELLRTNASRNANDEVLARQTPSSRAAERLAGAFGSWLTMAAIVLLAVGGLGFALAAPSLGIQGSLPVDLAMEAVVVVVALQVSLLLMTRKSQVAQDRLRADLDYRFAMKAELELALINKKIDDISERIQAQQVGQELEKALGVSGRAGNH